MPVTRADVIEAYRTLLGRPPESDAVIAHHLPLHASVGALHRAIIASDEYRLRPAAARPATVPDNRPAAAAAPPLPAIARPPPGKRPRLPGIFLGDRVLTETHRGQKIYVVPTDVDLTPHILTQGIWEVHVETMLLRLVRPGQHVVDIGANVGYHTLALGWAVGPQGLVHAFEASPYLARLLKASVYVNGLAGVVHTHNVAVTDREAPVTIAAAEDHFGSGNIALAHGGAGYDAHYPLRVEVPGRPLDALIAPGAPPVDLIHIDIEGAEPQALRGAARLIETSPGLCIVSEWSLGMMAARNDVPGFVDWLEGLGFRFWLVTPAGTAEPLDRAALLGLPHSDVVIARHLPPMAEPTAPRRMLARRPWRRPLAWLGRRPDAGAPP